MAYYGAPTQLQYAPLAPDRCSVEKAMGWVLVFVAAGIDAAVRGRCVRNTALRVELLEQMPSIIVAVQRLDLVAVES
jgi:hypothetical protein